MRSWYRRLTLARKLWLSIILVAVGLSALGLWQVAALRQSARTLSSIFQDRLVPIQRLRTISGAYGTTLVLTARAVRAGTLPAAEGQLRIQKAANSARLAWRALPPDAATSEEAALFEALDQRLREMEGLVSGLDERIHRMDPGLEPLDALVAGPAGAELGRFLDADMLPHVSLLTQLLGRLADLKEARAREAMQAAVASTERTQFLAPIFLLAGCILAVLTGHTLSEDLGGSVRRMAEHVARVADGELDQRIQIRGNDELAQLAAELNRMSQQLKESVETLQEREATQRSLLQSARTMIYTTDLDGRVQSFNHAAEHLLGYTADEVVGQPSSAFFHDAEELAQRTRELNESLGLCLEPGPSTLTHLPRHGQVEQREWTFVRRDGGRFPGRAVASPIRNDAGVLLGFLNVVTDISAQKRAELFQDRLRKVLDLSPDFVAVAELALDDQGQQAGPPKLTYTNKAFQELRPNVRSKGRDPELLFSYFPPWAVRGVDEEAMPQVLASGHWRGETGMLGPRGLDLPVDLVLMAHRDGERHVLHLSVMARDIRQEKSRERLLREREARLQAINRSSPVGIFITDTDGALSYVNPAFQAITGLQEGELPFQDWMRSIHPEDYSVVHGAWPAAVSNHAPFDREARFLHTDGALRWGRILAAPVWDEERFLGYVGCILDLTEVREAHAAIQASERRALAASQAKSSFLSNMSHELRTPLNAILGYAQLMARGEGRSPGDQEHLARIHNAGEHLLGLINDVLSIAKIEAGKLTLNVATFDTGKLFQTLHDVVAVRAAAKNLAFRQVVQPGFPERLEGDEGKLRQVLVNLLGNSVKFTSKGQVELRAAYAEGRARFEVEDTGPGISEADQARLFQSFYQAAGAAASEGTGLGLSISQAMVRLMGGEIAVRSEPGVGSAFSFEIPLGESEAPVPTPTPGKVLGLAPGQLQRRCLVADDRFENRDLLCQLLQSVGLEARPAQDGIEALEVWRAWRPHLIWMDIRMPRLDGYQALERIRAEELGSGAEPVKVIAITASVIDQDSASMMSRGFDDYLGKPFREEVVFDLIGRHLNLEFLREVPEAVEAEPVSLAGLRHQPEAWREAFREAVSGGDTPAALTLVDQVEDAGLAQSLRQQLKAYHLEELLAALDA